LGISRNSVVRAYDQLYAEGFIEGRVGDGTYVAQLPEKALPLKKLSTNLSTGFSTGLPTGLSTKSADLPVITSSKVIHSAPGQGCQHRLTAAAKWRSAGFSGGSTGLDLFPFEVWSKLQAAFWRKPDLQQLCYGDPAGDERLRGLIAAYLRTSRGLSCTAEQILITSGAQQGISLCAQLLVEPGEGVAVENPGYRAAAHAFAIAGANVQGVAVDQDGMDCAALAGLNDCRWLYVTPSHQYPTGVTMSLARRLELLAWAERTQGWIVEDDYDGEYRYSGAPLAPLAALDRRGG
jgi:GntR family transcriptional regulator / MocR family aminotransferase